MRAAITVKLKDNDGGNSLPLFDPANELRNLVENTAPNQNVGLPITAADGDSLTYTFDGPDMDRFTFTPSTAQLRTKSGQTYEYETHELFVVRVTADDGNGGTGYNSKLTYSPTTTADYEIVVSSAVDDERGSYKVKVKQK